MAYSEMFAAFDISCWTRDGMLAPFGKRKTSRVAERKTISWKGSLLVPAAAAALLQSFSGLQAGAEASLLHARFDAQGDLSSSLHSEAIRRRSVSLSFENDSKQVLSSLVTNQLPQFPAATMQAAKLAVSRIAAHSLDAKPADWVVQLARDMAKFSD